MEPGISREFFARNDDDDDDEICGNHVSVTVSVRFCKKQSEGLKTSPSTADPFACSACCGATSYPCQAVCWMTLYGSAGQSTLGYAHMRNCKSWRGSVLLPHLATEAARP